MIPGIGWVPPDHPLHPDFDYVMRNHPIEKEQLIKQFLKGNE
jgi:hypothetical protein